MFSRSSFANAIVNVVVNDLSMRGYDSVYDRVHLRPPGGATPSAKILPHNRGVSRQIAMFLALFCHMRYGHFACATEVTEIPRPCAVVGQDRVYTRNLWKTRLEVSL